MRKIGFLPVIFSALLGTMITQAHAAIKSIDEFTEKFTHFPGHYSFYADTQSGKIYLDVDKFKQPFLLQFRPAHMAIHLQTAWHHLLH